MTIIKKILQTLQSEVQATQFVVGYSGGLDSHVLLHALSQVKDISIIAVHVNHQLNIKADEWTAHCQAVCESLGIILHVEKIQIDLKPGDSLEEQARKARYQVLEKYLDNTTVLLTAHHLDDQAETFLLQALRGAGLKGLSAMPAKKPLGESFHLRPLLSFSRDQLEDYAKAHQLKWVDDDSNLDTRFDRNFLRQEIMPKIKSRFPAVLQSFSRSAKLVAESEKIIEEDVEIAFEKIRTDNQRQINCKNLLGFSEERQRLLLRYWLKQNNVRAFSVKQLKQIQQDVLRASPGAKPLFRVGDVVITRDGGFLWLG